MTSPTSVQALRPSAVALSLDAQAALLPQALGLFAVSLPIFVWAGSYAQNVVFMALSFAVFAINWGAFYVVVNWLKRAGGGDVRKRLRVHIASGLLWAACVAQIAAFGDGAGAAREPILMISVAAAVICIFFTAPSLPSLLIVGPAAMAGPLTALFYQPQTRGDGALAWGAFALAFALCLILNQNLRRQFALTAEREGLVEDKEQSLTRAEKLARSKSDLVATLSDEIRNGLSGVIHVLAAAAGQGPRTAPSREQLAAALAAANDLIAVLNATLDSENAQAGRLKVETARVDPVRLMRDITLQARAQALAKGLEFSMFVEPELEGGLGAATADAVRVRQILANLLGNAVRYTVRGRIEARIERRGEHHVAIAIADTGPGLSADELEQAFEPFRRIERTSAGVPGAGLGLSLSRQLAELMGARLLAQSAVGVGSCFTLELPYRDLGGEARETDPSDGDEDHGRSGLRVLVAEDDSLAAAMLRTILEQLGHQVVHAQTGRRALDLARVCDFDLAVVSGAMQGMDGPEVINLIRAMDGAAGETPVIAVIGGDPDEARQCLDAGADCIMRRPAAVSAVARAVADATARAESSGRGERPNIRLVGGTAE
jgi:signal transduction histidine kinase/ActR/RegA family two-component response regulator